MGKYFTVEVKPTIAASLQTGAFGVNDILFDWTAFDIPKGSKKLIGLTMLTRGADGADQSDTDDVNLLFAKSIDGEAPASLGTVNAAVTTFGWARNLLGLMQVDGEITGIGGDLVFMDIHTQPGGVNTKHSGAPSLVLTGEPDSGVNVGYDKLYVAGLSGGSFDGSTTVIARGGEAAGVTVVETDAGSDDDPNAELKFVPGDVLHSATDDVLGTVKSIGAFGSSKQDITFTAPTPDIIADDEEIYNIHPITFIFQFEA
tara:strand:+ start:375 stop:1148 length:774 start_codon:yes stop_codon:yes gene_type:complete